MEAWMERWNRAMDEIEQNLTGQIDYERLGRIACCSAYHFQRMFPYLAGVPLSEYVRRRRMSLAAADLQSGKDRIIDIAARYGYESPTAFNRAFRAVHGVAPSQVRSGGVTVKCYPRMVFRLTIQGGQDMQYRIETRAAFRVVGISRPLGCEIENNFREVPLMWDAAARDGTVAALAARMDGEPRGVLGISACAGGEAWRYWIAVASQAEAGPFETYLVPAATWAVFSGEGTGRSIQELEKRIVTEWLPGSGYEYADGPDIEVYLEPNPLHTRYEVWVPVTRRRE